MLAVVRGHLLTTLAKEATLVAKSALAARTERVAARILTVADVNHQQVRS